MHYSCNKYDILPRSPKFIRKHAGQLYKNPLGVILNFL
jgi:hypothetical protein